MKPNSQKRNYSSKQLSSDSVTLEPPYKMQIAEAMSMPGNDDQNLDRLSELPLPVFHHILSFLGANDVARLCLVSPRCQERCTSSHYMLFDVNFDDRKSCTSKCRGLRKLLHKLLDAQDGSELLQMHQFRLHWRCHNCRDFSPTSLFHRWVNRAVSCNAEEIDIGFFPDIKSSFILPKCLSRASTVTRILRLTLWGGRLNCLPMGFASIQVLSLSSIKVDHRCLLGQWISRHFASLKTLNLEVVRFITPLSITSSSLECLTISGCIVKADTSIRCPSLEHLKIGKCLIRHLSCEITVECGGELKSLLVDDWPFNPLRLVIVGPSSLKDFQITSISSTGHCTFYRISAESLCDSATRAAVMVGALEIDPRSMPSFGKVSLKSSPRLPISQMISLKKFVRNLNYIRILEIDIDNTGIMNLVKRRIMFLSPQHLEVNIGNLQELDSSNIRMLVSVICSTASLKTVTLKCQSDEVVGLLKSALKSEIPAAVEIKSLRGV